VLPRWLDMRLALSFIILAALGLSLYFGEPNGQGVRDPAPDFSTVPYQTDVWTATRNLSSAENATLHFRKHGKDMGIRSEAEYIKRATAFLKHPPADAVINTQPDGDTEIYLARTREFAVMNKRGVPRTYFKRDRPPPVDRP
jgi:hypothetical protein